MRLWRKILVFEVFCLGKSEVFGVGWISTIELIIVLLKWRRGGKLLWIGLDISIILKINVDFPFSKRHIFVQLWLFGIPNG